MSTYREQRLAFQRRRTEIRLYFDNYCGRCGYLFLKEERETWRMVPVTEAARRAELENRSCYHLDLAFLYDNFDVVCQQDYQRWLEEEAGCHTIRLVGRKVRSER